MRHNNLNQIKDPYLESLNIQLLSFVLSSAGVFLGAFAGDQLRSTMLANERSSLEYTIAETTQKQELQFKALESGQYYGASLLQTDIDKNEESIQSRQEYVDHLDSPRAALYMAGAGVAFGILGSSYLTGALYAGKTFQE